ncbi:hypothetical protein FRC05_002967 [Tulasnella sp. 425]|nr:hypothetical protein FRC05_002967 [Tulasnella sp. 425]
MSSTDLSTHDLQTLLEAANEALSLALGLQPEEEAPSGQLQEHEVSSLPGDISKSLRRNEQGCFLPGTVALNLTLQEAIRQPVGIIFAAKDPANPDKLGLIGQWDPSPLIPVTVCPAEFEKDIVKAAEEDALRALECSERIEMDALEEDYLSSFGSKDWPEPAVQVMLSLHPSDWAGVHDDTQKSAGSSQVQAPSQPPETSRASGRPRGRPKGSRSGVKKTTKRKAPLKRKREPSPPFQDSTNA